MTCSHCSLFTTILDETTDSTGISIDNSGTYCCCTTVIYGIRHLFSLIFPFDLSQSFQRICVMLHLDPGKLPVPLKIVGSMANVS